MAIYSIIRYILMALFLVLAIVLANKLKLKSHKHLVRLIILLVFLLSSCLFMIPFENIFYSFNSPQAAFDYKYCGVISGFCDGEESTMILYRNEDEYSNVVFTKKDHGWKLDHNNTYELVANKTIDDKLVLVYKVSETDDWYVLVNDVDFKIQDYIITDSSGSEFESCLYDKGLHKTYYLYHKGESFDYKIIIDGILYQLK